MPINNSRQVIQMTLEGINIKEFPSISAAAKQFGGTEKAKGKIRNACVLRHQNGSNSLSNIAHNFKWKFKENQ